MDELVVEFLTETNESLEELDLDLVNLEQHPNDADLLGKIFRLVHTIKGTCGFLALPRLEKVAHHGENVLGRFRDGDLEVLPEYVTLIFECIDRIKFIVAEIETQGAEPEGDDSELIEKLDAVFEGRDAASGGADAAPAEEAAAEPPAESGSSYPGGPTGNISQAELDALEAAFNDTPGPEAQTAVAEPAPEPAPAPTPAAKTEAAAPTESKGPSLAAQSLRVNVDVLENLMTMVSELVLTRNQLLQIQRAQGESELTGPLQRLNLVVSDLQEGVMKTRMQPIGNAWAKLPRIIRDLSIELKKKIDLEMIGQDTELDRQVLELIKDPLTHMVRNSGDHGIEDPAARAAAGKPETGKIVLKAFHEGGHIIIQIIDDGKGLPLEKIKEKAIANGLATAEELEGMPTQQINQFIFKAGFSTAEKVTSVSGRGVGMDVVRTNIEKIGGSIELHSKEGLGSTFTIKIPLTLAIVSALIVEAAGERFAIPQLSVRELVMTSRDKESDIETINGAPVFRLRDRLLPLISLSDLLKIEKKKKILDDDTPIVSLEEGEKAPEPVAAKPVANGVNEHSRNSYIVVSQVGTFDFGIIVDKVFDTEEIVVKPVANILRDIDLFSGNTILGDGSVIMILDPNGIAKQAGEMDGAAKDEAALDEALVNSQQKTSLLLFRAGDATPKAVPLSLVARLENVDLAKVEHSGGKMMVQYRDQLMPLTPFNHSVQVGTEGEKPVLVFADKAQSMGLVVDEIIDIKEEHIDVQVAASQTGLMGSAIIDGKATDVVDVAHYLYSMNPEWFKDHTDEPYMKGQVTRAGANGTATETATRSGKQRVLLVDDSAFFRNMLTPMLSASGYDVTSLESPAEALTMCDKGARFDIIVSDIEMPDMDGLEFAEKVQSTSWQSTPMVALTSHATPEDINRGLEVGFTKYIAKFDRDTLLNTLSQTLSESRLQSQEAAE
ncbi:MAG: hybrid sensor histidine kinase/response regulator [Alphaproteobacteria bacterium]